MDISKFTTKKTGDLVSITTPKGQDHSFLPYNLPPNWRVPDHLWPKVAEARAAVAKLDGIGDTLPDRELLLSPLKTREAITSSRLEGTYATAQELMLFEMDPKDPKKSTNDQLNTFREVSNYAKALTEGISQLELLPFCGMIIRNLHSILMDNVRGQHATAGQWRKVQVAIGSNWRYVPPTPTEVENCIDAFEKYLNEANFIDYDPLVRAYLAHYQFEAIHPFVDGNGRIGRVLLSLMIAKWCKLSQPCLYMSSFFEKYKDEYVANMFNISTKGAWETWIDFCLTGTIHQANDAIKRCAQLNALKSEMLARGHCGSIRAERIISGLFSTPFVRVSNLRKTLDVSYPTAQSDIDRLEKLNILQPLPGLHPKCYYSPEIYAIAYAEQDA